MRVHQYDQARGSHQDNKMDRHYAHEGSLGLTHIRPLPEPPAEHVKARWPPRLTRQARMF